MARTKAMPPRPSTRWRGALPRVPGRGGVGPCSTIRRRLKGKTTVSWFLINGKRIAIAVAQPVAPGPGPRDQVPGAHPDPDDVQGPGAHPDPGVQAPAAPDPFLPRDALYLQRFYDRMNLRRRNGDPWAARLLAPGSSTSSEQQRPWLAAALDVRNGGSVVDLTAEPWAEEVAFDLTADED